MAIPFYSETQFNKNPLKGLVVESSASAPSNPIAGQIYRNSTDNLMYWYNGTEWTTFGSGSGNGSVIYYTEYTYSASTYNPMEVTITDFDATLEEYYIFLYTNCWNQFITNLLINSTTTVSINTHLLPIDQTLGRYGTVILRYDSTSNKLNQICQTVFNYDTDTHNLLTEQIITDASYIKSGVTFAQKDLIFQTFDLTYTNLDNYDYTNVNDEPIRVSSGLLNYQSLTEQSLFGEINIPSTQKISNLYEDNVACYIRGRAFEYYDSNVDETLIGFTPVATSGKRCIVTQFQPDYDYLFIGMTTSGTTAILYPNHPIYRVDSEGHISLIDDSKFVKSSDNSVKEIRALTLSDYEDLVDTSTAEDNTIYEIYDDNGAGNSNFNIYGIIELPTQIATWLFSNTAPSSTVLTTYMQANTNTLNNIVQHGTLLKTTHTDSSNNIITYFFNINYSVEGSEFSYDFDCLNDVSKSFYIYYNGSYFLWNTESACFVGSTIVYTPNGIKFIEDIELGDEVLSYNLETKQEEYKKVNNIVAHNTGIIYRIELENDILECTYDEPFVMETNNVVQAQFLKMYDRLFALNNEAVIKHVTYGQNKQMVYDLSVEGNYNYFVGKNKVLVTTEKITKKEE